MYLLVIKSLDARQSNFIKPDEAKHVRRERAVRILSLRLFERVKAFDIERANLLRVIRIELARNPDKLSIRRLSFLQMRGERAGVHLNERRELLGDLFDVADFVGNGPERFSINAARQLIAVSV